MLPKVSLALPDDDNNRPWVLYRSASTFHSVRCSAARMMGVDPRRMADEERSETQRESEYAHRMASNRESRNRDWISNDRNCVYIHSKHLYCPYSVSSKVGGKGMRTRGLARTHRKEIKSEGYDRKEYSLGLCFLIIFYTVYRRSKELAPVVVPSNNVVFGGILWRPVERSCSTRKGSTATLCESDARCDGANHAHIGRRAQRGNVQDSHFPPAMPNATA